MLILPLSAALWVGVIKWVRFLDTRDFLEGLHTTAAAMAIIDAQTPKMPVRR